MRQITLQRIIILFVIAMLLSTTTTTLKASPIEYNTVEKNFVSEYGIEYTVSFSMISHNAIVHAENPTDHRRESAIYIISDGNLTHSFDIVLDPGESQTDEIKLRPELNIFKVDHKIIFSSVGASTFFQFEYTISHNSSGIKRPVIESINIEETSDESELSAIANITVDNPSSQPYPLKLMVHTTGTDGSFYLPSVGPNDSETITVELLDEPGSEIRGEARLYAGDLDEEEGGIHQVGFVGRAGGDTTTWNQTYEPVAPPWSDDPYQYENDSTDGGSNIEKRLSGGYEVGGFPLVYPVLAAIGLALLLVRRR